MAQAREHYAKMAMPLAGLKTRRAEFVIAKWRKRSVKEKADIDDNQADENGN